MIRIIPSIDIIGGSCIRLSRGDYAHVTIYDADALSVAKKYESLGFRNLHLVDLDGAREGRVVNLRVLEEIAGNTNLAVDFGGGIKTRVDLQLVFSAGAAQINIGSMAVTDQDMVLRWLDIYDRDRFILAADVRNRMVAYDAWQKNSDSSITDFIRFYHSKGIRCISCTDISRDGLLKGPAVKLYSDLKTAFSDIFLIAGGGISSIHDIELLQEAGIDAAIIGRALYEIPGFPEELAEKFL